MATKVPYKPFTCRDAIHHLCKRSRKSNVNIYKAFQNYLQEPIINLCKSKFYILYDIIRACQVPLCIIGRKKFNKNTELGYLVDVRHLSDVITSGINPIYWIIDKDSGVLLKETTKKHKIPNLNFHFKKYKCMKASLWEILNVSETGPEPQNLSELRQVLEKYNLLSSTNVSYCIRLVPKQEMTWLQGHRQSTIAPLRILAYTKSDLSIGYAFYHPDRVTPHTLPVYEDISDDEDEPDGSTSNRRVSVSVKMTGLLLAQKLGLCSKEEMSQMSGKLAKCIGAIWITCDEEKHPRHVTYHDAYGSQSIELFCDEKPSLLLTNEKKWTRLLKYINASSKVAQQAKQEILHSLIEKLKPFNQCALKSNWSRCLSQLQTAIKMFKVFVFCNDDTTLHHLKIPIAGVFQTRGSKGVGISTLANHTITALSMTNISFINLAEYFNFRGQIYKSYTDDYILWQVAQDWLEITDNDSMTAWSHPEIKHNIKWLKSHPKMFGETMICYTNTRSVRNTSVIHQLWFAFVKFMLKEFDLDLATQPHISLPKLAFDVVWLLYANIAGPFAHPIEKLHPHTVFKLRPWCKGGFSYSFENHLATGLSLDNNKKENAKSIQELDLTSAYGYSGMNMGAAKGFGIAFGENVKTQRRYKTFEYRATMYTIFKVMFTEMKQIKTVFSNYSPFGLVYIGKHALDLVLVLEDNSLRLYQFDGHFCHGDYNRPNCPSLPCYANNKTRQECEQQTKERDESILNWLINSNLDSATYTVITDCCFPEYSLPNLCKAFYMYHPLKDMIQGLSCLNGTLDKIDYREVTFLAIVEGHSTKNHEHEFGPIFNTFDKQATKPTTCQGKIFLTSDYYLYLRQRFGFKVTKIEWIIYYKVCEDLPKVFQKLVLMRQVTEKGSPKSALLKSLVNYACGYFGLNSSKQPKVSARIVCKLPKRFNLTTDAVSPLDSFGNHSLLLIKSYSKQKKNKFLCQTPLVLFMQIIEFGKIRLNESIQCLQRHLRCTAMHILYSNVDNLIIALSEDHFVDALEDKTDEGKRKFFDDWYELCGVGPGMLKQEWKHTSQEYWQFVSPCRMYHVLLTENQHSGHFKSTYFTGLETKEAFKIAMSLLNKERTQVTQEKKMDKLVNTLTHLVTYKL